MEERKTRVLAVIDEQRDQIVGFLQDLVRLRSINPVFLGTPPVEEAKLQHFLADKLRSIGFTDVDLWEPDPVDLARYRGKPGFTEGREFVNRPNLVARLPGSGLGRSMFLTGHVDVVGADPEREAWRHDPFSGLIEDGHVFGRGCVDMKGGIAAMIMAVQALRDAGVKLAGDVLVGTVVDEETGSMGMLSLADRGYHADAGIMTEPTDLQLSLLCRGIVWGRIILQGKAGHIEIAQAHWSRGGAVDAFRKGLKVVRALDDLNEEWAKRPDRQHPLMPRAGEVNVSIVNAGQHPSSFAEQCVITVDAQYLPSERDEVGLGGRIKREIEAAVKSVADADPWLQLHPPVIEWFVDADCAEVEIGHPIVGTLVDSMQALGLQTAPTGTEAHTDMSLLNNMTNTATVNFGPGDMFVAHQTNESIRIDDVIIATKVIALALLDWCGPDRA
jgi:acetylornithine deacetylase